MPITHPEQCRDKTADWYAYFASRRQSQLVKFVNDAVIAEHRLNPRGSAATPQSQELHELLNYIRNAPVIGKSFAYAVEPYKEYVVGVMTARGVPATFSDQCVYSTEEEAVHAVFLQRLHALGLWPETNKEAK